jgi:hypothetical protein
MSREFKIGMYFACLILLAGGVALAQHEAPHGGGGGRPMGEPHAGPSGYQRVAEPHGWNARPSTVDTGAYQHNFQAARAYHVGPYHRPPGWTARQWHYGEILPRAYWGPQFVNVDTGEILQVEYGVFA